jgi:hypothetical protein
MPDPDLRLRCAAWPHRPASTPSGVYFFVSQNSGHQPVIPKEQVVSEFIFIYRVPENYRGTADAAAVWDSWFDALGANLFDKGNPVFVTTGSGTSGGSELRLGGYSLISAENLDAAVELAKACPIIQSGGAVEVGELTPVPGRRHPGRTF